MKLKFYFQENIAANRIDVYLVGEDSHGKRLFAKPSKIEFFERENSYDRVDPFLEFDGFLSKEFFPALTNALAESGYKAESSDAGELKATKIHLEDMRNLVFNTLHERK